jgi:hypothetical protein
MQKAIQLQGITIEQAPSWDCTGSVWTSDFGIRGRYLLQLFKLLQSEVQAKMTLEELVSHKAFWAVALSVDKADVTDNWLAQCLLERQNLLIDIADPLQLVGVSMVMRAPIYSNQEDGQMRPI